MVARIDSIDSASLRLPRLFLPTSWVAVTKNGPTPQERLCSKSFFSPRISLNNAAANRNRMRRRRVSNASPPGADARLPAAGPHGLGGLGRRGGRHRGRQRRPRKQNPPCRVFCFIFLCVFFWFGGGGGIDFVLFPICCLFVLFVCVGVCFCLVLAFCRLCCCHTNKGSTLVVYMFLLCVQQHKKLVLFR